MNLTAWRNWCKMVELRRSYAAAIERAGIEPPPALCVVVRVRLPSSSAVYATACPLGYSNCAGGNTTGFQIA